MSEELEKVESFVDKHKVWIFGIIGVIALWYTYKTYVGQSAGTATQSPGNVSSGGGSLTGDGSTSGTSGGTGTDYGSAITALQNSIADITTQIGTLTAPVASSLGLTFSVGGNYDNSSQFQFGNTAGAKSNNAGLSIFGFKLGGSGSVSSSGGGSTTSITDTANNTKSYVSNLGLTETGLTGTGLSSVISQFVNLVSSAQTAAQNSGATPAWFVPSGNTPGSQLNQTNGNLVYVQPGLSGNPNNLLPGNVSVNKTGLPGGGNNQYFNYGGATGTSTSATGTHNGLAPTNSGYLQPLFRFGGR